MWLQSSRHAFAEAAPGTGRNLKRPAVRQRDVETWLIRVVHGTDSQAADVEERFLVDPAGFDEERPVGLHDGLFLGDHYLVFGLSSASTLYASAAAGAAAPLRHELFLSTMARGSRCRGAVQVFAERCARKAGRIDAEREIAEARDLSSALSG